jgi:hypothetical protein
VPAELRSHPDYAILRELGRGGMGCVYLAKNKLTQRLEALKVVNPRLFDEPGMAQRFLREIRSAARLDHPNIVKVHTALQVGALVVLVMEHVEGEDLGKVVAARGPLPVAEACACARQAALALQHAFEQGMVHRDVKPANLILARAGGTAMVKMLDFGLAKVTRENEETAHHLTGTGALLGTPDYLAPEQMLDASKADIQADIYSLGCTLYFLLSGRPPFQAKSRFELLQAHHSKEATPLDRLRPEVPTALAAVVAKMMAKAPADRYQRPAEVAEALEPFARGGAASASAADSKTDGPLGVGQQDAAPTPVLRETLIEDGPTAGVATARCLGAAGSRRWLFGAGLAGLLLAALIGLWAGGVLGWHTPEGILVLDVNEPNPEVYVDGDQTTVTWAEGGKTAEIRLQPGTRKVEVKKAGFAVFSQDVELTDGQQHVLRARLVALVDSAATYDPMDWYRWVHFGPGGPRVVLPFFDEKAVNPGVTSVRVYDLRTGNPVTPPMWPGGRLEHWTLSRDGKRLVTIAWISQPRPPKLASNGPPDRVTQVQVWDANTGASLMTLHKVDVIGWCALSPDGTQVVTTSAAFDENKKFAGHSWTRLWSAATGKEIIKPLKQDAEVANAGFSPDGKRLITVSGGMAQIWDAATGRPLTPALKHGPERPLVVHQATFSADGKRVVTASDDETARVWDAATGEELHRLKHDGSVTWAIFSADGKRVATGSHDKTARVWDAATGRGVTPYLKHDHYVITAMFNLAGSRLVTASKDGTRIWDVAIGKEVTPPLKHNDDLEGRIALFSPDGRYVAAVSWDPEGQRLAAELWDAASGHELNRISSVRRD